MIKMLQGEYDILKIEGEFDSCCEAINPISGDLRKIFDGINNLAK
jgi:hypothetical protein